MAVACTCSLSIAGSAEKYLFCKKEIPIITFENLSPPFKNHEYFQNHKYFPFEYKASSFSLVNAWWLAEASTLVYADEAFVRQRFGDAGLKRVKFFDRSSTQFFIASNSRFAIVAFRGSEIWKRTDNFELKRIIADLKTDIDIRLSDWDRGGRVHSGFKAALDEVWGDLLPEVEKLEKQGVAIWITGHSLGGALATLAADRLSHVQGLYTFGSPRIGDYEFKRRFRPKAIRVVNGKDIVARIPPYAPFRHVGRLKFINSKGDVQDQPGLVGATDEIRCGANSAAPEENGQGEKNYTAFFIPESIRDHVPLLYSILLWNELAESLKSRGES